MAERDELQRFAQRLNELCDEMAVPPKYNGRQGALGKLFSVGQKGARKWLEGEAYPAFDKIIRIAKWANVNVEWLSSGRGPKYLAPPEPDAAVARVIEIMQSMPEVGQQAALEQVETLSRVFRTGGEPAPPYIDTKKPADLTIDVALLPRLRPLVTPSARPDVNRLRAGRPRLDRLARSRLSAWHRATRRQPHHPRKNP